MRHEKLGRWRGSSTLLALLLGVVGGMALDRVEITGFGRRDQRPDFLLLYEASHLIRRFYVDRAAEQPTALTYGAISGMVDALGDTGHSRFLSPPMVKEIAEIERNKFEGIGAEVQSKGGHVVIVAPLDGSPAQRGGL